MRTTLRQKIILVCFSLFLGAILLEIGLRLAGAAFQFAQDWRNTHSGSRPDLTILCIGESTTALGGDAAYPAQLDRILNEQGKGTRFRVINKGAVGMDTTYLLRQLPYYLDKYSPRVVIAMVGINDPGELVSMGNPYHVRVRQAVEGLRVYKLVKSLSAHIRAKAQGTDMRLTLKPDQSGQRDDERTLKALLAQNLKDPQRYLDLAWFYLTEQDSWVDAQPYLRKAVSLDPEHVLAYIEAGWFLKGLGKSSQAEEAFRRSAMLNPKTSEKLSILDDIAFIELARLYKEGLEWDKAKDILSYKMRTGALKSVAAIELAWIFESQGESNKAEDVYKYATILKGDNFEAYLGLGWIYWYRGDTALAEKMFRKVIAIAPKEARGYIGFAAVLRQRHEDAKAQELLQALLQKNPGSQHLINAAAEFAMDQGKGRKGGHNARWMRQRYYSRMTADNYRAIKALLDSRKIPLLCVQYPMRSIKPLKLVFDDTAGITFVDNEYSFREAVAKQGYKKYFTDMFAGDFGHCTPAGNLLIAENVAKSLMKLLYGRDLPAS